MWSNSNMYKMSKQSLCIEIKTTLFLNKALSSN